MVTITVTTTEGSFEFEMPSFMRAHALQEAEALLPSGVKIIDIVVTGHQIVGD